MGLPSDNSLRTFNLFPGSISYKLLLGFSTVCADCQPLHAAAVFSLVIRSPNLGLPHDGQSFLTALSGLGVWPPAGLFHHKRLQEIANRFYKLGLGKPSQKKLLTFKHFSKVALTPLPPHNLDTHRVAFV